MRAKEAFRLYLAHVGRLHVIGLGDAEEHAGARGVTDKDNELLEKQINSAADATNWMVGIVVSMLAVVFVVGVFLVIRAVGSAGAVATLSAGLLLTLLAIVERLRRLWVEKAMLDIAWAGVREWPPEKVLSLVELIYWHSLSPKRKRSGLSTARGLHQFGA